MLTSLMGRKRLPDTRPRIRWMALIGAEETGAIAADDGTSCSLDSASASERATLLVDANSSVSTSAILSVSDVTTSVLHASEAVSDMSNRPASPSISK